MNRDYRRYINLEFDVLLDEVKKQTNITRRLTRGRHVLLGTLEQIRAAHTIIARAVQGTGISSRPPSPLSDMTNSFREVRPQLGGSLIPSDPVSMIEDSPDGSQSQWTTLFTGDDWESARNGGATELQIQETSEEDNDETLSKDETLRRKVQAIKTNLSSPQPTASGFKIRCTTDHLTFSN